MTHSKLYKKFRWLHFFDLKKVILIVFFGDISHYSLSQESMTDIFMWRDGSKSWMVNLSTGTGFNMAEWKGAWGSDGPVNVGDLNGDGMTDVFMWRDGSKSWTVNFSTGTGFNMAEWKGAWGSDGPINIGDLNGDGMTDVFMWRDGSKSWTVNLSTGTGFNMAEWKGAWGSDGPINVGDLNGDGRTDVFMWRDGSKSWTVNLSTGTGFKMAEWKGAWGSDGPINIGDLNGDGRTDAFMWRDGSKSWMVNLSTGTGFNMAEWKGAWGSDGPINVSDLNGDGRTDVFMWRDGSKSWTVNLSTGTGFNMAEWEGAWGSDGAVKVGDLNGESRKDSDHDGIADVIENQLIHRFRPYYKFSTFPGEDDNHPADAKWFVEHSELFDHHTEQGTPIFGMDKLSGDPSLILTAKTKGYSDVRQSRDKSDYYLNLHNDFRGGDPDWNHIISSAVGLYGHVAPIYENNNSGSINAYKIEYWQFYAYNTPGHEGDWEAVQLIIEKDGVTIRTVIHNVHSKQVRFDLAKGKPVDMGNGLLEYQGTGPNRPERGQIGLHAAGPAGIGWAQHNLIRFYCENGDCTHPVVYIEHGGHASWPTQYWTWPGLDFKHNGASRSYLVATPPNLGEINYPNPGCPGADLVLHFNGHWGAFGDGPEGPTVKKDQWGKK